MKIVGGKIDNFAPYGNVTLPDMSQHNIILFAGDNESGKSSLFDFFQAILFGWNSRANAKTNKQPRKNIGGELLCRLSNGDDVTVRRAHNFNAAPNDKAEMTNEQFRSRFIINLNHLTHSEAEAEDMMQKTSVGIDWQRLSFLNKEAFGKINEQLKGLKDYAKKLTEISGEIRELEQKQGGERYTRLSELIAESETERTRLQNELGKIASKIREIRELRLLAPDATTYAVCRKMLANHPLAEDGPSCDMWIKSYANACELATQKKPLFESENRAHTALAELPPPVEPTADDAVLLENAMLLRTLNDERDNVVAAINGMNQLRATLQDDAEEFQHDLEQLGVGWTTDAVLQTPVFDAVRHEELTRFHEKIVSLENRCRDAQNAFNGKAKYCEEMRDNLEKRRRELSERKSDLWSRILLTLAVVSVATTIGMGLFMFSGTVRAVLFVSGIVCGGGFLLGRQLLLHNSAKQKNAMTDERDSLNLQEEESAAQLTATESARANCYAELRQWYVERCGLLMPDNEEIVTPDFVRVMTDRLATMKKLNRRLTEQKTLLDLHTATIQDWCERAQQLTVDLPDDKTLWPVFVRTKTETELPRAEKRRDTLLQYQREHARLTVTLQQCEERRRQTVEQLTDYLKKINVDTLEAATTLKETRDSMKSAMNRLHNLGHTNLEVLYAQTKERLGDDNGDADELRLTQELTGYQHHLDNANRAIGECTNEQNAIVNSNRLTQLMERQTATEGVARLLFDQYATLKTAQILVDETRKEYKPGDTWFQRASEIANHMTGGKWTRLDAKTDNTMVLISGDGGKLEDWSLLSRGAREQIYLSLRMAFAVCYGETHEPMPIILDDVMVNFDEGRATSGLDAVGHVASPTQQVIMFSCHRWFAEAARQKLGERLLTVRLDQGEFITT